MIANQSLAANSLGNCRTTDEHAEQMFRYFEGLGIDLTPMRENPYEVYDTVDFRVTPYVGSPNGYQWLILTSFYEFANVVRYPVVFSAWGIRAKTDLNGPAAKLLTGFTSLYGLFR